MSLPFEPSPHHDACSISSIRSNKQEDNRKDGENDDVILINDNEISIKSLKNQQTKSSKEETPVQWDQNTTSDISELINENDESSLSVKDIDSGDDNNDDYDEQLNNRSKNESRSNDDARESISRSHTNTNDKSDSDQFNAISDKIVIQAFIDDTIDRLPLKNSTDDDAPDSIEHHDRHGQINAIINEAIDNLPIKQCVRISRDSLSEIPEDDEEMTIEILELTDHKSDVNVAFVYGEETSEKLAPQITNTISSAIQSDKHVSGNTNIETLINKTSGDASSDEAFKANDNQNDHENLSLNNELNINLIHMQNKIKELQDLAAGKYNCVPSIPTVFGATTVSDGFSSSRRDSLKDQPQSGRDSMSIATNSTEYRTFQEEYFNLNKVTDQPASNFPRKNVGFVIY